MVGPPEKYVDMWLVHLKVLIKTGGMEGLATARVLASYSWQLVAKKERVADAALNPPVLAALVIPGEQEEVKQNLGEQNLFPKPGR